MKAKRKYFLPFTVIFVGIAFLYDFSIARAEVLSFLENNPRLKAKLMQWETESSHYIKDKINRLRTSNAIDKCYAAISLKKKGKMSKGAILALIETFKDRTALEWKSSDRPDAIGRATCPAWEAKSALVAIGEPAVESLIAGLRDIDWRVRLEAVETLEKIDPDWFKRADAKESVPYFISVLKDENWRTRKDAAMILGKIRDTHVVWPLIKALKDKDWRVREAVSVSLGMIKDKRSFKFLINALIEYDRHVRKGIILAIEKLNPDWRESKEAKNAVPNFIMALKDKDSEIRKEAAYALGEIKDKRAVKPLIKALKDDHSGVRAYTAIALGKIKDKRAVEPLIDALIDNDGFVKERVAFALGAIGDKRAVEHLINALKASEDWLRFSDALVNLGKSAVESLIEALKDEDLEFRYRTNRVLQEITGKNFESSYKKWRNWWKKQNK